MEKTKVIVCGATFGQFYLEALKKLTDQFEVVGLLATGSERAKKCSENYQVPLYTNIKQLPEKIDLACVVLRSRALGGKGTDMALEFIERGIHVIQEQPIHPKDMEECCRAALKKQVVFQTGNLYVHLPEVSRFIRCARELNKIQPPSYVNATFCPQVSYPAMDILMNALPSIRNLEVHTINKGSGPFNSLIGKLNNIPINFEIHNQIVPSDPDNHMYLLHNIVFVYETGRLSLEDTFGPVIWNPRMHVPVVFYDRGNLQGEYPEYLNNNSVYILGDYQLSCFKKLIAEGWPNAVAKDLLAVNKAIDNRSAWKIKVQKELVCSRQWNEVTKHIGFAELLQERKHQTLDIEILKNAAK